MRWPVQSAVVFAVLGLLVPVLTGCGDHSEPPAVISNEQISESVPEMFREAPAEVRDLAAAVVDAIKGQDFAVAWDRLQELNTRPNLTDAQKQFVAESIVSVGAEVQQAEAAGNEAGQRALEFHRANK